MAELGFEDQIYEQRSDFITTRDASPDFTSLFSSASGSVDRSSSASDVLDHDSPVSLEVPFPTHSTSISHSNDFYSVFFAILRKKKKGVIVTGVPELRFKRKNLRASFFLAFHLFFKLNRPGNQVTRVVPVVAKFLLLYIYSFVKFTESFLINYCEKSVRTKKV